MPISSFVFAWRSQVQIHQRKRGQEAMRLRQPPLQLRLDMERLLLVSLRAKRTMNTAKSILVLAVGIGTFAAAHAEEASAPAPGDLRAVGKIEFPISGVSEVRPEFERGVALLHSFFYEEARRIFTSITGKDPKCAMAQWGIAMTWWHPIWTPPTADEMKAGTVAIDSATRLCQGSGVAGRERKFIAALSAYYHAADGAATRAVGQSCHGPVGSRERALAYEKEMRELAIQYPDDMEAQTFYALAILAVGYATPNDTTLSKQLEAAGILEKLRAKNGNHPGITHYLIHSYDYPALAERGLPAAQVYASIAPWVPHALHMPSHIFTRLGMWEESVAANQASAEASRAYAKVRQREATESEELHALDYAVYSYLQEGEDDKAKEIVDFAATVRKTNPEMDFTSAYALVAIPARYALERNDWKAAAALAIPNVPHWKSFPFMEATIEYAHALGRAHTGDLDGAQKAIARMQQLRDATKDAKFDYFKNHLDLQIRTASAWVACVRGKPEDAVTVLRKTADAEDILGKHPVSPGALVPVREQLGGLLLELGQAKEAQKEFEAELKIYPGRLRGLLGAAQSAEKAGDKESARRYYAKLAAQTAKAGNSRRELAHVREYVSK
jgi:tetratricopeptide (TPR) repeat protein